MDFKDDFIVKTDFIYRDDTDPININDIDLNKMKTSKKKIYSKNHNTFRYYIGYFDNNKVIPLIIELPNDKLLKNIEKYLKILTSKQIKNFMVILLMKLMVMCT